MARTYGPEGAGLPVGEDEDLRLEVRGVGPIELPVTEAQARRLCEIARPARYGSGELTLLDPAVRDTWEIPKSRVKTTNAASATRWSRSLTAWARFSAYPLASYGRSPTPSSSTRPASSLSNTKTPRKTTAWSPHWW